MENTSIEKREIKQAHNSKYYGYKNSKLNAITGQGWALASYPMLPKFEDDYETIKLSYRYIRHNGRAVRLEMSYNSEIGMFVRCVPVTRPVIDGTITFTLGTITNKYERYGLGFTSRDRLFYDLWRRNKWYYARNSTGAFCSNYINLCLKR